MKSSFSPPPEIFKPLLKCAIFKCISWLNGSFFGGEHRSFLKDGVKTYRMAPMSPLNSPIFLVCTSIVYASIMFGATPSRRGGKWSHKTLGSRLIWRLLKNVSSLRLFFFLTRVTTKGHTAKASNFVLFIQKGFVDQYMSYRRIKRMEIGEKVEFLQTWFVSFFVPNLSNEVTDHAWKDAKSPHDAWLDAFKGI